jgi:uncharacterized membrane protein YcaP (DUF421 family)
VLLRLVTSGVPLLEIVLRTAVVYAFILVGLRLTGKREIGQLTPFDLVLVLLLANAVQTAMVGPDTSLLGGLVSAAVLLSMNYALGGAAARWKFVRQFAVGTATILVNDGQVSHIHMQREGVTDDELATALREHGIDDIACVELAVLEIDGSISVVPKGQPIQRTKRRIRQFRHRG